MPIGAAPPHGVTTGPGDAPRLADGAVDQPAAERGLTPARGWQLVTVGYGAVGLVSDPAAGGVAEVVFELVPSDRLWLVERIAVRCTSAAATEARAFIGDPVDTNFVGNADPAQGNADVIAGAPPIRVPANARLRVRWTGADNGSIASARIQYLEAQPGPWRP